MSHLPYILRILLYADESELSNIYHFALHRVRGDQITLSSEAAKPILEVISDMEKKVE